MKAVYAVANRKGGTAKTTTAHALGAGLTQNGERVLFIDLDPQANLTDITGATQNGKTIYRVLQRELSPEEAIQHTESGDIIIADSQLTEADRTLFKKAGREFLLKRAIDPLSSKYDYVVIDVAPALNILTVNALTAATGAIITAQPDTLSLKGIRELTGTIETVKRGTNNGLKIEGILLTQYNRRAILSQNIADTLTEIAAEYGTKLFTVKIRTCQALREAAAMQQSIYSYAPYSNGAKDYLLFIKELTTSKTTRKRGINKNGKV